MGWIQDSTSKRELTRRLATGRLRPLARWAVDAVIGVELAVIRLIGFRRRPPEPVPPHEVTVIVKTFERPREVRRLVRSIRRLQPHVSIVVADDSRDPRPIQGAELVRLPFDSGVSAGRSAALARVRTPFVLTMDDDFVMTKHTDLSAALQVIVEAPEVDIVGGVIVNLPDFSRIDYSTAGLFPGHAEPLRQPGTVVAGCIVRLKVPNFFLARTASVRGIGWTDELKFVEHADFFTRASGRLLAVEHESFVALHAKNPFDRHGAQRQANVESSWQVLNRRYGAGEPAD